MGGGSTLSGADFDDMAVAIEPSLKKKFLVTNKYLAVFTLRPSAVWNFSIPILAFFGGGDPKGHRQPNLDWRLGAHIPKWCNILEKKKKKILHKRWRMGRLICHAKYDGQTVKQGLLNRISLLAK